MKEILIAALKTGGGTVTRIFFGVITMKIFALVAGPSGIGLLSVLRQITDATQRTASMSSGIALTQGISSRTGADRSNYLCTTFLILLVSAILFSSLMFLFGPAVGEWALGKQGHEISNAISWISLPVLLGVMASYFTGVLNGYRAVGQLAITNVAGTLALALLAYPVAVLVTNGKVIPVAWMLATASFVTLSISAYLAWQQGWALPSGMHRLWRLFDKTSARQFFSFAGVTFFTGMFTAITLLVIKGLVTRELSLAVTGVFDVAWMLSVTYIMLLSRSFLAFYLPTLSATRLPHDRAQTIGRMLRFTLITMAPLVMLLVTLKPMVVSLLYSDSFLPSLDLIRWMLLGDFLKVTSWTLSYCMIAFGNLRTFFWVDIAANVALLFGSWLSLSVFHTTEGIGITFLTIYTWHLLFCLYYVNKQEYFRLPTRLGVQLTISFTLILAASLYFWSDRSVDWTGAFICFGTSVIFALTLATKSERSALRCHAKHALRKLMLV